MASGRFEERLSALEKELARLKAKVEGMTEEKPWGERIAGTFHNDPVYEEAMKLGRQYRRSLKRNASSGKKKPFARRRRSGQPRA
jgi:hypothetical protein